MGRGEVRPHARRDRTVNKTNKKTNLVRQRIYKSTPHEKERKRQREKHRQRNRYKQTNIQRETEKAESRSDNGDKTHKQKINNSRQRFYKPTHRVEMHVSLILTHILANSNLSCVRVTNL